MALFPGKNFFCKKNQPHSLRIFASSSLIWLWIFWIVFYRALMFDCLSKNIILRKNISLKITMTSNFISFSFFDLKCLIFLNFHFIGNFVLENMEKLSVKQTSQVNFRQKTFDRIRWREIKGCDLIALRINILIFLRNMGCCKSGNKTVDDFESMNMSDEKKIIHDV